MNYYKYSFLNLVAIMYFCVSCSTVDLSTQVEESASQTDTTVVADTADQAFAGVEQKQIKHETLFKNLELKLAQMWVKLDSMEQEQSKQKARMKILEKGLLLGITPQELLDEVGDQTASESDKHIKTTALSSNDDKKQNEDDKIIETDLSETKTPKSEQVDQLATPLVVQTSERSESEYKQRLSEAQELFASNNYGKAIAEYSSLIKDYPDYSKDGSNHYWIALSWFNLKEYQLSEKGLLDLVKTYPNSTWTPHAYLYLAKSRFEQGFRESALTDLKYVIDQYPNDEAADMAKKEITNMGRTL